MKKKDILITGGAGYIGSHTLVELYNSGYRPIVVDNLSNSSIANIKGAEQIINTKIDFYQVDCTDFDQMDKIFIEQKNIDAVIHFAAFKSVEESVRQPEKYFSNNIGSLETLINLMNSHNINNIIFSSSCTVYGTPEFLPVNELAPFGKAESPYGETKQLCEKLIEESKVNSISLRYFNPVGSHPSGFIGDCSADKPNNLVPIICEVASGKRKSMQIFGNDYNTHDGTCIRDYIHVVDLAKAHVMAVNHILNNTKIKTAYNLGVGKGLSVREVVDSFEKVNNLKISYKLGPRRAGDVEKIYSENKKINEELGWFPVMSFESALETAWNWEKLKNL
jgi:UDP-glucose 4-epimerase